MIVSVILIFGYMVLNLLLAMSAVVNFVIPNGITDSLVFFLGYLGYLDFAFPIATFLTAVGIYVVFLATWYTFKIFLYFVKFVPIIGSGIGMLPKMSDKIKTTKTKKSLISPVKVVPRLRWKKDSDGLWRVR